MPRLARIVVYPVKSLPGVEVSSAALTEGGALAFDREYALFDDQGRFVNAKQHPAVHCLGASCVIEDGCVLVVFGSGREEVCTLRGDAQDPEALRLAGVLSDRLGMRVRLARNPARGFPDDEDSPGPTVISQATLVEVSGWFPGLAVPGAARRFRANLEIEDCPAFWEDRLYGARGTSLAFTIGSVRFLGVNPCKRCVVPTRDPESGARWPQFQRTFVERRRQTLPDWADRSQFDIFYRLAVNTRVADTPAGKAIQVGDEVQLIDSAAASR